MCVNSQKVALNSFSGLKSNGASSATSSHFGGDSLAMLQRSPVFAKYGFHWPQIMLYPHQFCFGSIHLTPISVWLVQIVVLT